MTEAELQAALAASLCTVNAAGQLVHPGLQKFWAAATLALMGLTLAYYTARANAANRPTRHYDLTALPIIGNANRFLVSQPWLLLLSKAIVASIFLLIVFAGLFGTPIPERNIATVLTWNIWWAGLVIAIAFTGSAWCAVCPWDTLSTVLVRRQMWGRVRDGTSLNLRVPNILRSVWPAAVLLVGLTWLELGFGVTVSPYATAVLGLAMVVLATLSLAVFERKALCRYFCPVGRTVGAYSQLAPVELRSVDPDICARCTTLDCYHGNQTVEPCPTHLVMGRLTQNTYCTSCGNCTQSCPHTNVAWRLRSPSAEAIQDARPHWDEAGFMLALLSLVGLHGLVMTGIWENWHRAFGLAIGESGQMLVSFTLGFTLSLAVPVILFAFACGLAQNLSSLRPDFRKVVSHFSFSVLPLAFAYHVAHNLNHLLLEGRGLGQLFLNPLGEGALPLSRGEKIMRGSNMFLSQDGLNALQAIIMAAGFALAIRIILARSKLLAPEKKQSAIRVSLPVMGFALAVTGYHMWLLSQPMLMRY
jgi:polyferredoxin